MKKFISSFLLTLLFGVFPCQISHAGNLVGLDEKEINHHHENHDSGGIHCENSFPIEEIKNFQNRSEEVLSIDLELKPIFEAKILTEIVKISLNREEKEIKFNPPDKFKQELLAWNYIRLII